MVDCISSRGRRVDGLYRNIKFLGTEFPSEVRDLLLHQVKES